MQMIVKCQCALTSNQANPPILVYDQERRFEGYIPMDHGWQELFKEFGLEQYMGAKFFAKAHLEGKLLVLDEALEEDLGW